MGNSLQDQLLKAGLVDKDKVNKANKQKKSQVRKQRSTKGPAKPKLSPEQQRERAEKACLLYTSDAADENQRV